MKIRDRSTLNLFDSVRSDATAPIRVWVDPDEPTGDNFAGGGGAKLGIVQAFEELKLERRAQDVAVNHWPAALAMYAANHPRCKIHCEDVRNVNPLLASGGKRYALAWFSPTCIFFSQARGGELDPDEATSVRGLASVMVDWARSDAKPRVSCLENVKQFRDWGPLHRQHTGKCSPEVALGRGKYSKKRKRIVPKCLKGCCYGKPIKARKGEFYRQFEADLRKCYRFVEWRVLKAHHYGAPTSRERGFLIASDEPVIWPEPTHGPGRQPVRTAAECIDWSIECPSIFERSNPLKEKTLARIRAGIERFVFGAARPFIVPTSHGGEPNRAWSVDEPAHTIAGNRSDQNLVEPIVVRAAHGEVDASGKRRGNGAHAVREPIGTVTTSNEFAIAAPLVMKAKTYGGGGNDAKPATEPLGTVTTSKRGEHAIATPTLVRYNGQRDGEARGQRLDEPASTLDTSRRLAIATPVLAHIGNGEREGQAPRCYDVQKPLGTICAQGEKHGLALPVLVKNYSERETGGFAGGQPIDKPAPTITQRDHNSIAAVSAVKLRGTDDAHVNAPASLDEPLDTISAGGRHHALTAAYLLRYNGSSTGQEPTKPISTIDTRDRFALVTLTMEREVRRKAKRVAKFLGYDAPIVLEIDGEQWILVDIGFRMLVARELFRCQGFPDTWIIDLEFEGKPLSKTAQIKCCGNSVPPQLAKAVAMAAIRTIRYEERRAA